MATPMPSDAPATAEPQPRFSAPVVSLALIGACLIGFGASWLYARDLSLRSLLLRPIDVLTLIACGAKDRQLIVEAGEWWRLVSAGFLHGHLLHLALNIYALRILGPLVERVWGTRRFILIYVAALVSGNLLSMALTPLPSVGASGGVFGLFGAVAVFSTVHRQFVRREARVKLWLNLGVVAALNIGLGIALPFIDNAAHAGGLAGGAFAALILRPVPLQEPDSLIRRGVVHVLAVAAGVAVVWSLASAVRYAASPDTMLLARSRMEARTVKGGAFEVHVPKTWIYTPPEKGQHHHIFDGPGGVRVVILAVPRDQSADLQSLARSESASLQKHGARPHQRREVTVGDRAAIEIQFRRRDGGAVQRIRVVVFPSAADRLFAVTCICPDARYPLLEVLFDKVIQSIRATLPEPRQTEALRFWRRLIDDPADVEAYVLLAAYYRIEGRPGAAEQALRTAIRLRPRYAPAHDQLAYLYATAAPPYRRPAKAIESAQTAVRLEPNVAAYHATLAIAFEAVGARAAALDAARRAAALAPDDARYADLVKRLSTP